MHQGSLPRLVVALENHHHCLWAQGRPQGRARPAPRRDAALLSSRASLITALEVSEFVNIIKASIPGREQQAQSLQMSARDGFGWPCAVQSPGFGQD